MNWPLFRVWVVASVLWAIGTAGISGTRAGYNPIRLTGEFDWMEQLRHFGWREYLYHSGWVFGLPMLVLLIGSATYAVLQWIATGDDQGLE